MTVPAVAPEIDLLLKMLDDAYQREAWHGPSLRSSIVRLTEEEAAWRPAPGQRNIWEITVHAAYWKYAVWRRLSGSKRGRFPRKGSNWFVCPTPECTTTWRGDIALLDDIHQKLVAAVAALPPGDLPLVPSGSTSNQAILTGIALHDVYHAGQIQQLRSLYKARSS